MCYWRCGLKIRSLDGRAVKIDGNPEHPNNRGVVCGKGNAGLMVAYDPDRLKFPMRRAGERGENKWQQIGWDEALDEVAHNLSEIKNKYGPQSLVLMHAILGIVWMLVIGVFAFVNLREQTLPFLKEILVITPGKAIRAGTYMAVTLAGLFGLMKSVKVAPQGRYNGAVQLLATMIIFGSLAIVATGLYLFFAPMLLDFAANPLWGLLFRWSLLVHFLAVAVVLMGLVAHIYFGVVEGRESLEAMKSGKLDVGFIKHHSPLWYEELKKEGRI